MNEEPIATYVEKNIESTGRYSLYSDRLEVSVRYFLRGRLEASVPLSTFTGTTSLVRMHSSVFNLSLWALVVAVSLLVVVSVVLNDGGSPLVYTIVGWFFLLSALATLITARRLKVVTIYGVYSIAVGKGPSGLSGMQAFVAQVLATRSANQGPAA